MLLHNLVRIFSFPAMCHTAITNTGFTLADSVFVLEEILKLLSTLRGSINMATIRIDIKGGDSGDFTPSIDNFLENNGLKFTLAFSGGADDGNPIVGYLKNKSTLDAGMDDVKRACIAQLIEDAKEGYITEIIYNILAPLRGYQIAVLCGGTTWGVPRIAAQVAKSLGFKTIGVFPLVAREKVHVLGDDLLDLSVCVHPMVDSSKWGDETPIYCKLLDAAIVIGGGAGTMVEIAHLLKINESKSDRTRHILPVFGTGGTADKTSFFPGKPNVMADCMPPFPLHNAKEVLEYLNSQTDIDVGYPN